MKIGLYHGYELTGSGSNEYTRYLARAFLRAGQEVHIICREPHPEKIPYLTNILKWNKDGDFEVLKSSNSGEVNCTLHQLPHGEVRPVFLTDKQREGNVKSFVALSDEELNDYHKLNQFLLTQILSKFHLDVLHANHMVYQPVAALSACQKTQTPLIVFPHGSAIEYTIKLDKRFKRLGLQGILGCQGLIVGNREVQNRILGLYPDQRELILDKSCIVGVGVDTSLFQPVEIIRRGESIKKLIRSKGGGGKNPKLTTELHERIMNGELEAVRDYWDGYDHSLPDTDLNDHLRRIPWDQHILLFVGALTVGKGLQSLITALPFVLQKHPQTHLVIVGAGAYREVLEAYVFAIESSNQELIEHFINKGKDLDRNELTGPWEDVKHFLSQNQHLETLLKIGKEIENHVHFLGRLDHSRLQYLFPCADLAIFPSVIPEAYPLVLMESLSNGVLPMVSYFSGFKDGVDELTPFLGESIIDKIKIPIENDRRVQTIINNLRDLLSDHSIKTLETTLRKIAVENHDWQLKASEMLSAYRRFRRP